MVHVGHGEVVLDAKVRGQRMKELVAERGAVVGSKRVRLTKARKPMGEECHDGSIGSGGPCGYQDGEMAKVVHENKQVIEPVVAAGHSGMVKVEESVELGGVREGVVWTKYVVHALCLRAVHA